jgi:hypothetical protein
MLIHCTQKLAARLKNVSTKPLAEANPLGSWHANCYTIDRRLCVIFCHDLSRYVLFMAGLRKEHFTELGRWHRELFLATLRFQDIPKSRLPKVELALGPIEFDRANDRSVLSSMNVVRHDLIGWLMRVDKVTDLDPVATALELNERPVTIKGKWLWPDREMLHLVESL